MNWGNIHRRKISTNAVIEYRAWQVTMILIKISNVFQIFFSASVYIDLRSFSFTTRQFPIIGYAFGPGSRIARNAFRIYPDWHRAYITMQINTSVRKTVNSLTDVRSNCIGKNDWFFDQQVILQKRACESRKIRSHYFWYLKAFKQFYLSEDVHEFKGLALALFLSNTNQESFRIYE